MRRPSSKKQLRWLRSTAVLIAAAVLFLFQPKADYRDIRVSRVYDGDTVSLANGERVRLIGIDCPEAHENDKLFRDARKSDVPISRILQKGRMASRFTRELLLGKKVMVEFDAEREDRYGRTLGYLWLAWDESEQRKQPHPEYDVIQYRSDKEGRQSPYLFINAVILKAGYADPLNISPNTRYASYFQSLFREARAQKRGIFKEE